jgi:hypothetical protein
MKVPMIQAELSLSVSVRLINTIPELIEWQEEE